MNIIIIQYIKPVSKRVLKPNLGDEPVYFVWWRNSDKSILIALLQPNINETKSSMIRPVSIHFETGSAMYDFRLFSRFELSSLEEYFNFPAGKTSFGKFLETDSKNRTGFNPAWNWFSDAWFQAIFKV